MGRSPKIADRAAGRDNHFNLIRLLAALGVLVSHSYPISFGPGATQPLERWTGSSLGEICVYIFFATSGFFITKSFVLSDSWRRFVMARALRLFPALAAVLCVTLVVAGFAVTTAPAAEFWMATPDYFIRNFTLFFLQYGLPGVFVDNPYGPVINGSLWTLSYEVTCYAGVFVVGALGLFHAPRASALFFLVVVGSLIALRYIPTHVRLEVLARLALPFVFGSALFVWRARIPLSPWVAAALALAAAVLHGSPVFEPVFILTLSYATFVVGLMRAPLLLAYNRLGDYSYGLYVYAFPVQQLAAHAGVRDPLVNIAVSLPVAMICAVLSWVLVERVALRYKPRGGEIAPPPFSRA